MEGCNLRLAHLLVVKVEPQVMRAVIALVELFSVQVDVPHDDNAEFDLLIIIIIETKSSL